MLLGSKPTPDVELACGSASINKVFFSKTAKLAAILMALVVLPTPPFWLAKVITLLISYGIVWHKVTTIEGLTFLKAPFYSQNAICNLFCWLNNQNN
jgi:hypothetical protein